MITDYEDEDDNLQDEDELNDDSPEEDGHEADSDNGESEEDGKEDDGDGEEEDDEDEEGDEEAGDEDDEEDPDGDSEDPGRFYQEVEDITGIEVEVDYDGEDPLSPKGVAMRELAISRAVARDVEETLRATSPRGYAYLAHKINGGTDEEFFGNHMGTADLPVEDEVIADVDLQRDLVIQAMRNKGNKDAYIAKMIKLAEDDDSLEEMALDALEEMNQANQARLAELERETEARAQQRHQDISEMSEFVDRVVDEGDLGSFKIPARDKAQFANYLKNTVRYDNGKFYALTEISKENVGDVFRKEFFAYKGGDLGQLIERQARTENTRRLKATYSKQRIKSVEDKSNRGHKLSDI